MGSEPAIRVESLGKKYHLAHGQPRQQYRTLRETLSGLVRRGPAVTTEEFWALTDVSFEVRPGEVVGIIGRNGAGKSTLLKILSRITKPTAGRVEINGRVGSLLEVGTGFHPELTGRENVFLNGSILGMSRREIARKFDEIVAFAEVEKFLDTPVKRYSSGMYVRLAFAVAAHLEPEILIVDEVLAVGDAAFQKKCLNKMGEVGRDGRTILYVSHDLSAINRLCTRAVQLAGGRVQADGPASEVTAAYLAAVVSRGAVNRVTEPSDGSSPVRLLAVTVCGPDGPLDSGSADIRWPLRIQMEYEVLEAGHVMVPNIHLFAEDESYIFVTHDWSPDWRRTPRPAGVYTSTVSIPGNFLSEGLVTVAAAMSSYLPPARSYFHHPTAAAFQVHDPMLGDSARGDYAGRVPGVIRPTLPWQTERVER